MLQKRPSIELNSLAVEIVRRCIGDRTCLEIIREMARCFRGVDFDMARATSEFLTDLSRQGIVFF
ncbi:MAG: PqqD family protein, partial [Dehalococcoidia bacterium]|nr:PqqD family protein [Dehalococcoidia bacterium]